MRRRARYSIITEILETCRKPALQTHVMYKANLSYEGLKSYLKTLIEAGLLGIDESKESVHTYVTTKKGLELLEHSHAIKILMGDVK